MGRGLSELQKTMLVMARPNRLAEGLEPITYTLRYVHRLDPTIRAAAYPSDEHEAWRKERLSRLEPFEGPVLCFGETDKTGNRWGGAGSWAGGPGCSPTRAARPHEVPSAPWIVDLASLCDPG
jgi:hypothetical protein